MKILGACYLAAVLALMPKSTQADELSSFVVPGTQVEKIAQGFGFIEGPVWHPGGWLLFSDIPKDTIYRWTPGPRARRGGTAVPAALVGSLRVFRRPSGRPNGLALDRLGRLIVCEHDRRVVRVEADGSVVALAETLSNKRLNSPNDLALKRDGSIYFTDPPYGLPDAKSRELAFSGVYRVSADGRLSVLTKEMPFPNGIAFSPDETRLYVVDSEANQIRVFDVMPDGGLGASRVFAEVRLAGSHEGPDGIKVDALGNVFCAGPDGVWIFAPDGRLIGKIPTPEVPANLAFGGPDHSMLFITARTGLYRVQLKTSVPLKGHG